MAEAEPGITDTFLIQERFFEDDQEFAEPEVVVQKLTTWLRDPERSSHFHVRCRRRPITKEKPHGP